MKRILQPALVLATLAFGVAPALTPPFTGYDPAIFPVVIARPSVQPAGYAFAIWGLIYLWLIAHAGFGILRRRGDAAFLRPALQLFLALMLGTIWLAIAPLYPILATMFICIMADHAVKAFLRADPVQDRWLLSAPLAIFAGWLTAACCVSTGVVIAGYGVLSDTAAALTMLAIALGVGMSVQWSQSTMPVYGLTVAWASTGIAVVNWGVNMPVAVAAALGAITIAVFALSANRIKRARA